MHGHRDRNGFVRHLWTILFALLSASPPLAAQFGAVGLSGVRGQRFGNENLPLYPREQADLFASALAVGDFNGDGADDLAAGVPGDNNLGGFTPDSGIVVVRYGIPGRGLDSNLADDVLTQAASGSPDPEEVGDEFGGSLAACDINQDGFDDLVVGILGENSQGVQDAGAIQIHFGFPAGLPPDGDLFLTQGTAGIPGDLGFNRFGGALACADFNGDGYDDLAVGAYLEDIGGFQSGNLILIPGGTVPLDLSHSYELNQNSPGMADQSEMFDNFGGSLAAGDFDADGFADLIVGVPNETDAIQQFCGAVQVLRGGLAGLTAGGNLFWTEPHLGGTCIDGNQFGSSLAAGDFDGDGRDDVLIGDPTKDFEGGAIFNAGQVVAVYGADGGLDPGRVQFWIESFVQGSGTSETRDRFGAALAVGDFDADGVDDAAISHPGESGLASEDGEVSIVMGSPSGLTSARVHRLSAGFWGHPGVPGQAGRNYGATLATGDFDGDGYSDLALGAPRENEVVADSGALVVLYGSLFADGFDSQSFIFWSGTVP